MKSDACGEILDHRQHWHIRLHPQHAHHWGEVVADSVRRFGTALLGSENPWKCNRAYVSHIAPRCASVQLPQRPDDQTTGRKGREESVLISTTNGEICPDKRGTLAFWHPGIALSSTVVGSEALDRLVRLQLATWPSVDQTLICLASAQFQICVSVIVMIDCFLPFSPGRSYCNGHSLYYYLLITSDLLPPSDGKWVFFQLHILHITCTLPPGCMFLWVCSCR